MAGTKVLTGSPVLSATVSGANEFSLGTETTIPVVIQNSGLIEFEFTYPTTLTPADLPNTAKLMTLTLSPGDAPVTILSDPQMVCDLPGGDQMMVHFRARIAPDAPEGRYNLPLMVHYTYLAHADQYGQDSLQYYYQTKDVTLDLPIQIKPEILLDVVSLDSGQIPVGAEGFVTVGLRNQGHENGTDAVLVLAPAPNSPVQPSVGSVYIGDFPAGSVVTVPFKVAAKEAIDHYGTGTHGVRSLAGTLNIHRELEETIADFKHAEAAVPYSSGYATNLTVVSTLVSRGDYVISDKLNHASIVDGCLMSGAKFLRFAHNDMEGLEHRLQQIPEGSTKLVIADSVFSMDGDIINFPRVVELCRKYHAWLMIDEAHSVGVLGKTGRGIEEHFDMQGAIDIKMGTLSKTIPSLGGYVAGSKDLINYLRHASRAYIFSAALLPAQAAAAKAAFEVILDEPWRVEKVNANGHQFIQGLKQLLR